MSNRIYFATMLATKKVKLVGVEMKKDTYFKLMFALEMALLPLAIFAKLFLPVWSVGLFVAGILLCKIWREIFRNRQIKYQTVVSAIANIATSLVLLALFMSMGILNKAVGIIAIIVIALKSACEIVLFDQELPEFVDSVAYCAVLFECLTMFSMTFAYAYATILTVCTIASILTGVIYVGYTVYYLIKNMPKKSR